MAPLAKKKEHKGPPTPDDEQSGSTDGIIGGNPMPASGAVMLRLSLKTELTRGPEGHLGEGASISKPPNGLAPGTGFVVSYSILGQPEGQAEALSLEQPASLAWEKEVALTVDEAFVRTAVAAYGRICLWLRPAPGGQDPARSPSAAQDKGRPRPPSGKSAGKPRGSTDEKRGGKGGVGQVSKSLSMKRGSVDKAGSPSPLGPDPAVSSTDNEGHDHGPPREWGAKEGACLLVLEAAPLLANQLHVERTFLLEEQPKPDGGLSSPPETPKAGPSESCGLPVAALSVESVLAGYSRVVVAVTLTQPLLPDALATALNPVVLTPLCLRSLPDQPATCHALDTLCAPIRAELRLPGHRKTFTRTAAPQPWRAPPASTRGDSSLALQVRDAVFEGPPCILLAGPPSAGGLLYEELLSSPLEVRVFDRSPAPRDEAPLFPPPPPAETAQASNSSEAAQPPSSEPPAPVCESYGVARLSLSGLCCGGACFKVRGPIYPVSTTAALMAGEENDWKTRPGLYMQAQSSIALHVEAAVPLTEAPGTLRPFGRVIVRMAYADGQILNAVLAQVRSVNAGTLRLAGDERHVLKTLATMQLSAAQQADHTLDLITGFQVIDAGLRLLVLEGLRGGSLPLLEGGLREQQRSAPLSVHILMNPDLRFRDRLYGTLGADVQPVKLRSRLSEVAGEPNDAIAGRLKPECHKGVVRLAALTGITWLREALQLFPTAAMVEAVYRKYGAELTPQDVTGCNEDSATNADSQVLVQEHASRAEEEQASSSRAREANRKGRTDSVNQEFLKHRQAREPKDRHKENLAKIEALSATSHATRVAVQSQQRAVILQEVVNAPKMRSPTFNTSLHEKPFLWPAPREPVAFRTLPNQPSEARTAELGEAWVESPDAALSREGAPGSVPFQTVVAPAHGALFEKDAAFFTSVFTAADSLAKKKSIGRDESGGLAGPPFATVTPLRKSVGQLDKYTGLLHDPPAKPGLTGRAGVSACPVSMLSAEPYVEASLDQGKVDPASFVNTNVDFRRHISPPKTSVAKRAIPDVTVSEKTSNPSFQAQACRAPIEHQSVFKVTSWYQKEATDQP